MKLLLVTFYKLKMMLSDKVFFTAMIIIPLFITIATGYALRHEKLNIIPLALVDEDGTDDSLTLISRLTKKEGFSINITTGKKASDMLKNNKVEAIFIINAGFKEKISRGDSGQLISMAKSPSSVAASYVQEIFAGEVMRFIANSTAVDWVKKAYTENKKKFDENVAAEVIKYCDSQWEPRPLMTVIYKELDGSEAVNVKRVIMPAATATSAGIIVVFIMFYILFSSGWLVEERINGTLKRLVSGSRALWMSFAGNICALAISGLLQIVLFSIVNRLVFDVDLFPSGMSYIVFGAYLLSVISISMFISSILKTPAQLQAGAPVFALLTGFAGGCFWNFVDISKQARQLSMLTPQGWALEGVNRLLINPSDLGSVVLPLLILCSISLILLPLSYLIIKRQVAL